MRNSFWTLKLLSGVFTEIFADLMDSIRIRFIESPPKPTIMRLSFFIALFFSPFAGIRPLFRYFMCLFFISRASAKLTENETKTRARI